jgi:hypothetical protein
MAYNLILLTFGNSVCFYRQRLFAKYFHGKTLAKNQFVFNRATIIVYGCIQLSSQIFNYHKQNHSERLILKRSDYCIPAITIMTGDKPIIKLYLFKH